MPKVNQEKLAEQIQEIIIKQFIFTITHLESPKQTASFFSDFLTDSETIMMSKRVAIAILLLRDHSQTAITQMLSVSYSATGAVSSWLKNASPSTMLILNRISQDDDWKEIVYNHRVVNASKKTKRGRKAKSINPTVSEIGKVTTPPAKGSSQAKTPDLNTLEGPELILDEIQPTNQGGPSMQDLLED
ncbi:Trp family transcriptional regulator [Patescibacteria group bacterium]